MTVKHRPFHSPQEFSVFYINAVYIQPPANTKLTLELLHSAASKQQDSHLEGVFIVVGDFNQDPNQTSGQFFPTSTRT